MKTSADLLDRLQVLHARTAETPLFNPVFQLSLDLSREIEGGALDLGGVEAMVAELECEALKARAARLRGLIAPVDPDENLARFRALAAETDLAEFCARWERPLLHAVFTAHPTFLLAPVQADAVAHAVSAGGTIDDGVCVLPGDEPAITMEF